MDDNEVLVAAGGWCAPSDPILDIMTGRTPPSPEAEYHCRPCNGQHRWERWVDRPQCDCSQCDYSERYVECAGCPTEVRERDPEFEELWEAAPWA